jgi:hypothetical protein
MIPTESDKFHLRAAVGWLELGNHIEADAELDNISPEWRACPAVLEVRWHIYSEAKNGMRAWISLAP